MEKPILEVKNAVFGYEGKSVLKNINFQVTTGSVIGLVGPNGAGKSTILKTLSGLMPLLQGNIFFGGQSLATIDKKIFAGKVAYLQQHHAVPFNYTVKELVAAGRYPYLQWWEKPGTKDTEVINECLEYMGLATLQNKLVNQLSGGQRQRVFLAKILAQQTSILFLDEPTADLDFVYKDELFKFAGELAKQGRTIIMAIHELGLAYQYCSNIMLLGQGKVLTQGAPKDVITGENLSLAYGVPVQVRTDGTRTRVNISRTDRQQTEEEKALLAKICQNTLQEDIKK